MTIICTSVLTKKGILSHNPISTYGLSISLINSPNVEIDYFDDVFADRKVANDFCDLVNKNEVDEINFIDVLEDYLATT